MFNVFIIGPAGSGKTALTNSLSMWLDQYEVDNIKVNLDPAVKSLPYDPEVDVRDYINIDKLMMEYGLGPNGAIIAATDLMTTFIEKIVEEIRDFKPGYVIIDTPGQMELFTFRAIGEYIIRSLSEERNAIIFVIDSILALKPSTLISLIFLSISTLFRFNLAQLNVLNKCDMLNEKQIKMIEEWVKSPEKLFLEIERKEKGMKSRITESLLNSINEYLSVVSIIPISAKTGQGLDNLYALLQRIYVGGEDYVTL